MKPTETLGNPMEYEFSGSIVDLGGVIGNCICGHPIRYEYSITNGIKDFKVGSECINHFSGLNDKLYEDLKHAEKAYNDEIKEAKKKIAWECVNMAVKTNKETLKNAYSLNEKIRLAKSLHIYMNAYLYTAKPFVSKPDKQYASPTSFAKWYIREIKRLEETLDHFKAEGIQDKIDGILKEREDRKSLPLDEKSFTFGKYANVQIKDIPESYLTWILENVNPYNENDREIFSELIRKRR